MSKVSELNKLALKLTGENPYKKTIKESLDVIATYLAGEEIDSENIEDAIQKCTEYYSGGGGGGGFPPDWTEIGYNNTPQSVIDGFEYAKQIYDNWDNTITSMESMFDHNKEITIMPLVDTSNVTTMEGAFGYATSLENIPLLDTSNVTTFYNAFKNTNIRSIAHIDTSSATYMRGMFESCSSLVSVPLFNTSKVTSMKTMFSGCAKLVSIPAFDTSSVTDMQNFVTGCNTLSNESLNNILSMCTAATKIASSNKKLSYVGITVTQAEICTGLSNYTSFLAAGWTTGY